MKRDLGEKMHWGEKWAGKFGGRGQGSCACEQGPGCGGGRMVCLGGQDEAGLHCAFPCPKRPLPGDLLCGELPHAPVKL